MPQKPKKKFYESWVVVVVLVWKVKSQDCTAKWIRLSYAFLAIVNRPYNTVFIFLVFWDEDVWNLKGRLKEREKLVYWNRCLPNELSWSLHGTQITRHFTHVFSVAYFPPSSQTILHLTFPLTPSLSLSPWLSFTLTLSSLPWTNPF